MTVNLNTLVGWYVNHEGKLTYSMYGSRNGSDGTADCSGSVTQALYEASGVKYAYLYNTASLPSYLQQLGFKRISVNQDWNMMRGDVILWSDGLSMADSGGAGGHVMVAVDGDNEISTDYSTQGRANTAVQIYNYNQYYAWNQPNYVEVWRYVGSPAAKPASKPAAKSAIETFKSIGGAFKIFKPIKIDEMKQVNGGWQYVNYDLANGLQGRSKDFDWTNNGIPFALGGFNPAKFKPGMTISPMISGTIDEYDLPSNGCGVNFGAGIGMIWFNADALLNRF